MRLSLALLLGLVASSASAETLRHDLASERRERVTCSIAAALKFGVPTNIMLAVADVEGGRPGLLVRNRNGSFDIGSMQFNTRYLRDLERRYGITASDVAAAGCYPYELAAWRLRKHLEFDDGDAWTRTANYHSRTAAENRKYRAKLIAKAASWARWLSARFGTQEVGRALVLSARREPEVQTRHQQSEFNRGAEDSELAALLDQLADGSDPQARRIESLASSEVTRRLSLRAGVQLPQHPGYTLVDRSRSWGTSATVLAITAAFDDVIAVEPTSPRLEVHDLSLRFGGHMRGHKSHQSGRDVDITYYQRGIRDTCVGRRVSPGGLDAVREWRLLRHWLERGQSEFIFVDYSLQAPLYAAARADGTTDRQLAEWFQYPRGPEVRAGIIRHVPNHANHVHVRFRSSGSRSCLRCSRPIEPNLVDEPEVELMEQLAE